MKNIYFIQSYKGLPQNTYLFFLCKILLSLNTTMIPMLSLILNSKLHFDLSITGKIISIITMLLMLGIYIGGLLCDKMGAIKTMFFFQLISCTFFLISIFIPLSIFFFITISVGIFLAMAIGPPMDTLISQSVPIESQKKMFSLCYLGTNIGYSIFIISTTYLYNYNIHLICLLEFVGSIAITILLLIYIKKANQTMIFEKSEKETKNQMPIKNTKLPEIIRKNFWFFCTILMFSIVYSQFSFTIPLVLNNSYSDEGVKLFGRLGGLNACLVITLTPMLTQKFERYKNVRVLSLAGIIYAFSFVLLILFPAEKLIYLPWIIFFTIGEILYSISVSAYISKTINILYRSRVYSITNICVLVGFMMGQNIVGILANNQIETNWLFVCGISLIVAMTCRFRIKEYDEKEVNSVS